MTALLTTTPGLAGAALCVASAVLAVAALSRGQRPRLAVLLLIGGIVLLFLAARSAAGA